MKLLIPVQSYKRRNVANAIDFFGHLMHYALEVVTLVIWVIGASGMSPVSPKTLFLFVQMTSALIPMTMICMSKQLQNELELWFPILRVVSSKWSGTMGESKND